MMHLRHCEANSHTPPAFATSMNSFSLPAKHNQKPTYRRDFAVTHVYLRSNRRRP